MRVYDYQSIERPSRHCREEVAVETQPGVLLDTFWDMSTETHRLTDAEKATAVLRFDTDDFDELDRYDRGSPGLWMQHRPEDRELITSQHRLQNRWFVRKGSTPDLDTKIENARADLDKLTSDAESAARRARDARKRLDELIVLKGTQ